MYEELIIAEIGKLAGLKLQGAGRASNLFWLGFGDMFPIFRGGKTKVSVEYTRS